MEKKTEPETLTAPEGFDIQVGEITGMPTSPFVRALAERELLFPDAIPTHSLLPTTPEQTERVVAAIESIGELAHALTKGDMIATIMKFSSVSNVLSALVSREVIDPRRFTTDATNVAHMVDTFFTAYAGTPSPGRGSKPGDVKGETEAPEYFSITKCGKSPDCAPSLSSEIVENTLGDKVEKWAIRCEGCGKNTMNAPSAHQVVESWNKFIKECNGTK